MTAFWASLVKNKNTHNFKKLLTGSGTKVTMNYTTYLEWGNFFRFYQLVGLPKHLLLQTCS